MLTLLLRCSAKTMNSPPDLLMLTVSLTTGNHKTKHIHITSANDQVKYAIYRYLQHQRDVLDAPARQVAVQGAHDRFEVLPAAVKHGALYVVQQDGVVVVGDKEAFGFRFQHHSAAGNQDGRFAVGNHLRSVERADM